MNAHRSFIQNSQKLEVDQVAINTWMVKQIVIQIPQNTVQQLKKRGGGQTIGIHNNCDESPGHFAEVKSQFPKVTYYMISFT